MNKLSLTQSRLKELLAYYPRTGVFRWTDLPRNQKKGLVAGSVNSEGYRTIRINCKRYRASRLAYLYVTGDWPLGEIDHINHVRDDNRYSNLRDVSPQENKKNKSMQVNNSYGISGVYVIRPDKWVAQLNVNRRRNHLYYGDDFFEACCARKSAENKYGVYTARHGV